MALLSALPNSPHEEGVLDTSRCYEEITRLFNEIRGLEITRDNLIYQAQSSAALASSDGCSSSAGQVKEINRTYGELIAQKHRVIDYWYEVIASANSYSEASAALYNTPKDYIDKVLGMATLAVNNCIAYGSYYGAAFNAFNANLVEYRVELAKPYLTPEELAAYKEALGSNGIITSHQIYSGPNTLNEDLYSALAKLPCHLVTNGDITAIAIAYERMWTIGFEPDTDAIERFIALSYVLVTDGTNNAYNSVMGIYPNGERLYLFEQSPLLARVTDELLERLPSYSTGSLHYQERLAGVNLMSILKDDNNQFWSEATGIDANLGVIRSYTSDGKDVTAILCPLVINPLLSHPVNPYNGGAAPGENNVLSHSFFGATGQLNAIGSLLDALITNTLNPAINPIDYLGSFVMDGTVLLASEIPVAGDIIKVLDFARKGIESFVTMLKDIEEQGVATDPSLALTSHHGAAGGGLMSLFNFAFNLSVGSDSTPKDLLGYKIEVYISDINLETLKNLTTTYEDYQRAALGLTTDDFARESQLTAEGFLHDLKKDPLLTIAGIPSMLVDPTKFNTSHLFVNWCGSPAELEYARNMRDDDGVLLHSEGDPVKTYDPENKETVTSNYSFIAHPDAHPDYRLIWLEKDGE